MTLGWPIENLHGGFGMVHPGPCTLTERDLCEREETEPTLKRRHQPGCGVRCRLLLSGGDALGASAGGVSEAAILRRASNVGISRCMKLSALLMKNTDFRSDSRFEEPARMLPGSG